MRGALVGGLVLVAIYVLVQDRASRAVAEGGSWLVSGLRRFMSPDVAAVPQRRGE